MRHWSWRLSPKVDRSIAFALTETSDVLTVERDNPTTAHVDQM